MQEIGEDPEEAKRIARNNYMKFYRSLRSSLHILKVHHQICPVTTHTKSSQWGGFAYCYGYLVPNYTHIYDYIWISKYMKIYFQIYIYIHTSLCVCLPPYRAQGSNCPESVLQAAQGSYRSALVVGDIISMMFILPQSFFEYLMTVILKWNVFFLRWS